MKVLMMTDLEGVAGVVSFTPQVFNTSPYYNQAKQLLTGEINAAIEGALDAGASDILVIDGHGAGGVCYENLHPVARLMHGRPLIPVCRWAEYFTGFDVGMMIGQHAMAGLRAANMNHTQSADAIDWIKLNGQMIGEIAQFAMFIGSLDIPLIFLAGDDDACREAEQLIPNIVTASVKTGLGRNSAISCGVSEARRLIREGSTKAIAQHHKTPIAPSRPAGPFVLEKRFFHTDFADSVEASGYERVDGQTVRKRGDDLGKMIYG